MSQETAETYEGRACDRCGSTTRYKSSQNCRKCNRARNKARTWSGPLTTRLRTLVRQPEANPFDRPERRNSDDSGGAASYYRGAFFDRCELCGRGGLVDGIVCGDCSPLVNAPAAEAHYHEPDITDVVRRLEELRA